MRRGRPVSRILRSVLTLLMLGVVVGGLIMALTSSVPGHVNQALAEDGRTWYVDDDGLDCPDADFSRIRDAMDASSYGDTIVVCPGDYHDVDAIIEAGRKVIIEVDAVWRVRSLLLREGAHLIMRGILYWQKGFSIKLETGARISLEEDGRLSSESTPFLVIDEAQTDKITYSVDEPVQIVGLVLDQNGAAVSANVTVEIEKPDGTVETVSLDEVGTGNYEAVFEDTSADGSYRVVMQAELEGYTGHAVWLGFEVEDFGSLPGENGTVCVETATGTGMACFTPSDGTIEDLTAIPAYSLPSVTFPHGMFSFQICCLTPGQTVTLTVTLPSAVPVGTLWWKYHNGQWSSLPNLDDNGNSTMKIRLTDGGTGDSDGLEDGFITDPGGPGNPMTVGWETSPINKLAVLAPWVTLLAAILAGAGLLMLRRRRGQEHI